MTEGSDEIKIEINPPPKSIEIQPLEAAQPSSETNDVAEQPSMLTGGIQQIPQQNILDADSNNFKFVMGPNGQLIAMQKPPFVWKDFLIGGGIPFVIVLVPLLVLIIGSGLGLDDTGRGEEMVTLYKEENSTAYLGEFSLEEENYLSWCGISNAGNTLYFDDFYCDRYEDYKANINKSSSSDDEVVGYWNNENGTVYFDAGVDYGERILFDADYYSEEGSYGFFMFFGDLMGLACCGAPILSIIFLIIGFSQGKPGMGWGGVAALVSIPVLGIISLGLTW